MPFLLLVSSPFLCPKVLGRLFQAPSFVLPKGAAMRTSVLLPLLDVGHEHPRTHDVLERGVESFQRAFDVAQRLHRLHVGVAHADDLALLIRRRRSSHEDLRPDAHRA